MKNNVAVPVDESKICSLEVYYDADIHDALANLRRLGGDIPVHPQYGMSIIPPKKQKITQKLDQALYCGIGVLQSVLFILFELWSLFSLLTYINRFFLFLVLDKAVCPFLKRHFDMGFRPARSYPRT
jgi:hypothetical protein